MEEQAGQVRQYQGVWVTHDGMGWSSAYRPYTCIECRGTFTDYHAIFEIAVVDVENSGRGVCSNCRHRWTDSYSGIYLPCFACGDMAHLRDECQGCGGDGFTDYIETRT